MKKTYLTLYVVRPCVYLIDGGGAKLDAQGGPGKGSPSCDGIAHAGRYWIGWTGDKGKPKTAVALARWEENNFAPCKHG